MFARTLLLLMLIWSACAEITAQPCIRFDTCMINVGKQALHKLVRAHYFFTNTGNQPLLIQNVRSTGGGQIAEWLHDSIAPGHEGWIKLLYNSQKIGPFHKVLYVNAVHQPDSVTILHIEGYTEAENWKDSSKIYLISECPQQPLDKSAFIKGCKPLQFINPADSDILTLRFERGFYDMGEWPCSSWFDFKKKANGAYEVYIDYRLRARAVLKNGKKISFNFFDE